MSNGTKYWTWHMAAGVVLLILLGLHMLIMHMGGTFHLFAPQGNDAVSIANSQWRDSKICFTITYVLMLGVGLYHGLYGLRTILFELTLKPVLQKSVTAVLFVVGVALFALGSWAAWAAHAVALAGGRG
jgi:succinate dehydrogenase / fumarate reductase membrane anchor subunit